MGSFRDWLGEGRFDVPLSSGATGRATWSDTIQSHGNMPVPTGFQVDRVSPEQQAAEGLARITPLQIAHRIQVEPPQPAGQLSPSVRKALESIRRQGPEGAAGVLAMEVFGLQRATQPIGPEKVRVFQDLVKQLWPQAAHG